MGGEVTGTVVEPGGSVVFSAGGELAISVDVGVGFGKTDARVVNVGCVCSLIIGE
jgi:hypothetical protein